MRKPAYFPFLQSLSNHSAGHPASVRMYVYVEGVKPFGAWNVIALPARSELGLQREMELIAPAVEVD